VIISILRAKVNVFRHRRLTEVEVEVKRQKMLMVAVIV